MEKKKNEKQVLKSTIEKTKKHNISEDNINKNKKREHCLTLTSAFWSIRIEIWDSIMVGVQQQQQQQQTNWCRQNCDML